MLYFSDDVTALTGFDYVPLYFLHMLLQASTNLINLCSSSSSVVQSLCLGCSRSLIASQLLSFFPPYSNVVYLPVNARDNVRRSHNCVTIKVELPVAIYEQEILHSLLYFLFQCIEHFVNHNMILLCRFILFSQLVNLKITLEHTIIIIIIINPY